MLESQDCVGDCAGGNKALLTTSSEALLAPPPAYENICSFVAEHAGRLPTNAFTGTPPYEYTGCDYALILYSIMPSNCVDLSRLCWSTTPLPAQLKANLAVFCDAACGLQLPDAPISSLQPPRLASTAACIVHHIKVQHWLFVLSQRFRPEKNFDAMTVRMRMRNAQLGEPRLKSSTMSSLTDARSSSDCCDDAFSFPSLHCNVLWKTAAIEVGCDAVGRDAVGTAKRKATALRDATDDFERHEKPWKSAAARPWRTAAAGTFSFSKPLPTSPTLELPVGDCAIVAKSQPKFLADQWRDSEFRRLQLKETLAGIRHTAQCALFANGRIDFDSILSLFSSNDGTAADVAR